MRKISRQIVLLLFIILAPLLLGSQKEDTPGIDNPKPGESIQGVISIVGTSSVANFQHSEVSYTQDQWNNPTWFLIQQNNEPITGGVIAVWDTSNITDGIYSLRLVIFLKDGRDQETIVTGLRVRNYTLVETNTPETVDLSLPTTPVFEATLTRPARSTPTNFPPNPAQVSADQLSRSTLKGAMFAIGLAIVIFAYRSIKKAPRRKE